jgi:hypothetical protein
MRKRYPDFQHVVQTEEQVLGETRRFFGEREWKLVYVINDFLKLPYFNGAVEPSGTNQGDWQAYCVGHYAQMPHTMLSVYRLWRQGYYLETSALLRHLLEVFVQMRYFERNLGRLRQHWTGTNRRDFVMFRAMFDELAPNSYELVYKQFSKFAHGNLNLMFRAQIVAPAIMQSKPMMYPFSGSQFDEVSAIFMHIYITGLMLGFVNYHPVAFPQNTVNSNSEFSEDLAHTKEWLEAIFDEGKNRTQDKQTLATLEQLITP